MELQLIRNATLRLFYAGRTILIDPLLGSKGTLPSFAGIAENPTVDLPMAVENVLEGVEVTLISHLHPDHFDSVAASTLPKSMPILCQAGDLEQIAAQGFTAVEALTKEVALGHLTISPTSGQHGTGEILTKMGSVIGFIFKAKDEPTVYWAGDTILTAEVLRIVDTVKPDVIVTHSGGALLGGTLLIMDDLQTIDLCRQARTATVIAVHMEALDHCTVTRSKLRNVAEQAGISRQRLFIPSDGEQISL